MRTFVIGLFSLLLTQVGFSALKQDQQLQRLQQIAAQPELVSAVAASNEAHATTKQREANKLNRQWRSERKSKQFVLIKKSLDKPLSQKLAKLAKDDGFSNLVLVDRHGFNVAQAAVTTYYWQGRQNFWRRVIKSDSKGFYVGRTYRNRATKQKQHMISVPVLDKNHQVNGVLSATVVV